MKLQRLIHAFVAFLGLGPLAACASDTGNDTGSNAGLLVCTTTWFGTLPGYVEPSVRVRACLNEGTCSDEHVLTPELGASREYETGLENEFFHFGAAYYPSGSGNYIGAEENNLDVVFEYSPEFATTLADDDRATLVVNADDGSTMTDSISQVPYRSSSLGCKGVYLDLDGSERLAE